MPADPGAVRVLHDTLTVLIRDTIYVPYPDTVWAMPGRDSAPSLYGITPAHALGWLVTIGGFYWAGRIAVKGWDASAANTREQQERAAKERRQMFLTLARNTIGAGAKESASIIEQFAKNKTLPMLAIRVLIARMEPLRRCREEMATVEDSELREAIEFWQTYVDIIGDYVKQFADVFAEAAADEQRKKKIDEVNEGFLEVFDFCRRMGNAIIRRIDGEPISLRHFPSDEFNARLGREAVIKVPSRPDRPNPGDAARTKPKDAE